MSRLISLDTRKAERELALDEFARAVVLYSASRKHREVHVVPLADEEHKLGLDCSCQPKLNDDGRIVMHVTTQRTACWIALGIGKGSYGHC